MTDTQQVGLPDKRLIAASFSRAAASYDSVAALQRRVGERLLAQLPVSSAPRDWLDLGCGTGYFSRLLAQRFPGAQGVALDIAEGMLLHARREGGAQRFVVADAEHLPLRDQCLDLLFSSLALQWCADFGQVLSEAQRVLRPGGLLLFSSLCSGTLAELRDSWRAVDGRVHVNRFRPLEEYRRLSDASGLRPLLLNRETEVLYFSDLRELTHEFKALGASNLNPGRPDGLTGRARVQALRAAYEAFRQPQGLPATYQVVYGVLRKEEECV